MVRRRVRRAMLSSAITVFSERTGKPLYVLDRQQLAYDNGATALWVNHSGTVMIAARPLVKPKSYLRDSVIGVQTRPGSSPASGRPALLPRRAVRMVGGLLVRPGWRRTAGRWAGRCRRAAPG